MGRRPDPAGVREQKAPVRSTRVKAAASAVDQVAEGGFKAPKWLTGEGLTLWQKLGPTLRQQRLLQATDEPAFARYCRNTALWVLLRKGLDKDGYTYEAETTAGGKLRRADPSFLIADRLERQLLAVEDRFGMNPAERQRIIAARAQGMGQGELPLGGETTKRPGDPATPAAPAAAPIASPVGLLN